MIGSLLVAKKVLHREMGFEAIVCTIYEPLYTLGKRELRKQFPEELMWENESFIFFIRIISGFEKGLYDMEDLQPTLWRAKSAVHTEKPRRSQESETHKGVIQRKEIFNLPSPWKTGKGCCLQPGDPPPSDEPGSTCISQNICLLIPGPFPLCS